MTNVRATEGQTLTDIAIRELGSTGAAYELALLNGLQLDEDIEAGQVIELSEVANDTVATYYKNNNKRPVSGLSEEEAHVRLFDHVFDELFE